MKSIEYSCIQKFYNTLRRKTIMSRTWVLVASSAEAQLLESRARRSDLHVTAQYSNADGRAHEGDLVTDGGAAAMQFSGCLR
tara:strand:+ start:2105 stop:2350 length:246 start_codon:yes stop_codon:yes gene_type:complete